ncbi:MAG TPA: polysaccharide deacetylase family protein [Candidatus Binatia bacterium]|nr:polysaccharide deacetylase family protein [Candidatus Binatia bacterium]
MSVTTELKSLGHAISFRSGLSSVIARHQGCGRILMYHGVARQGAQALVEQLRYLVRHFKVVPMEAMVNRLDKGSVPLAHEIVLTFDDGLRNNFTVVYPILRELQVPATMFVCPALMESGEWLWNHEMRCRLQTLAAPDLAALRMKLLAPGTSVDAIVEWMKTLRLPQRRLAEVTIRQASAGFRPTAAQREAFDIMDWKDLRALDRDLITVGSHTLSHPILTTLSGEEIESEILESRRCLEQQLERPVDFFCYPNGAYDKRAYQVVQKTYRAAVTTESGVIDGSQGLDRHRMPRIPSAESAALTAWRLHRPEA